MRRADERLVALDGLRALAALAILVTHVAFLTGFTDADPLGAVTARLNVGVALFFLLSAFLLYRPWVSARFASAPGPDVRGYVVRRAVRILPAYWAVLLVVGVLDAKLVPGALSDRWWVHFGLFQAYSSNDILGGVQVAWSLCTEVAFYTLLPFLAYGTRRLLAGRPVRQQVHLELGGLAVSAIGAFALRSLDASHDWLATWNSTLVGRWPWFAAGLALAVMSAAWTASPTGRSAPPLPARMSPWLWWSAAAAALAVSCAVLPRNVFFMGGSDLQVELLLFGLVAAFLMVPLILPAGGSPRGPARLMASPPMVWLGTVSYGIFLWHYPVITWLVDRFPTQRPLVIGGLSLAVTLAAASASWYALERPLMRRVTRLAGARDRRATVGAPVAEPAP